MVPSYTNQKKIYDKSENSFQIWCELRKDT